MSKIQENKILANLIKADLQDALENDSRWKVSGLQHFFHEYWVWWDKEIWVCSEKNEELKKALAENRIRNQAKREETKEKETKKNWKKKLENLGLTIGIKNGKKCVKICLLWVMKLIRRTEKK